MKLIAGMMMLEMNCALNDASNSSSFFARNRSSTCLRRPNTLTSAWPVNASSI